MQPRARDVGNDVLIPSIIDLARKAFLRDDLTACLRAIDTAKKLSPAEEREVILLRARVLLRQLRHAEAVSLLGKAPLSSFLLVDEACTARMLHGVAVARSGKIERGLVLLTELDTAARTLEPHPTIRAEIEYWLAFVYWLKRDYPATLTHARAAERANADVVSVRAATLRGFVVAAKERYQEALALFRWAFDAYSKCEERDEDLRGRIVMQIASLEVALRSAQTSGTHTLPPGLARIPYDADRVPSVFRLQIATFDAWLHALDGDRRNAYDHVRVSENLAPSKAWRVWALANRALLSAAFGDLDVAYVFAKDALETIDGIDWNATADEERVGLLLLAEALARTYPAAAPGVLERYNRLTSKIDRALLYSDDVRLWIVETWVHGLVYRISGENEDAWQAFKAVHENARRVGLLWQATQALIELDSAPAGSSPSGDHYLECAALLVRENFPRSFLERRLGRWAQTYCDPIAAKLPRKAREVLRQLLEARSTKEIASALGISTHTVRDYVEALLRAFNVHSKDQLLVECYRRGIGDPSWWSLLDEPDRRPIVSERSPSPSNAITPQRSQHRGDQTA